MIWTRAGWTGLLALYVTLAWSSAVADPIVDAPTGLAFPDEIAGLARGEVRDYEKQSRGAGRSYGYDKKSEGIFATVYLYTYGIFDVPRSLSDPRMSQIRDLTYQEIRKGAEAKGETVDGPRLSRTLNVTTDHGDEQLFFDSFLIRSPKEGTRNTFVWLWPARGHFAKVRYTLIPRADGPDQAYMRNFFQAVVRLTTEPYSGKRVTEVVLGVPPGSPDSNSWLGYGLGLAAAARKSELDSLPLGAYQPTFESELYARETQLKMWRELNRNHQQKQSSAYMDALASVADGGFLREYVWHHHRRPEWPEPAGLRNDEFAKWQSENLKGHKAETRAGVLIRPAPAK
jgi:hypothetical protein